MSPPIESITVEAVTAWLRDAVRLVELAESEPANRIARKSRVEKTLEENPGAVVPLVVFVVLAVPFVLMLVLALFFIVGWRLFGEGVMVVPIIFMFFFMPYAMFLVFRQWYRQARDELRPPE